MTDEIWKIIPGFESYQVSNIGSVRNSSGRILKLCLNGSRKNNKYLAIMLQSDDKTLGGWRKRRKLLKIHRLVLMTFNGLPKEGEIACHRDNDKFNNNIENLYWGTHSSNAVDSIKAGTFNFPSPGFGNTHHSVKYSEEFVEKIRNEYTGKWGEKSALARKYDMSVQTISPMLSGKTRKVA